MIKKLRLHVRSGLPWFVFGSLLAGLFAFSFLENTPRCVIGLEKMNALYVGIDNPATILVRGVPDEQLTVTSDNLTFIRIAGGKYNIRAKTPGPASATVSVGGMEPVQFKFRVKAFPDPVMHIGNKRGGSMLAAAFRAQGGLAAVITGMDICGNCETVSYNITRIRKGEDPVSHFNSGARFNEKPALLVEQARPGDVFFFDNIKVRCAEEIPREMEMMKIVIE